MVCGSGGAGGASFAEFASLCPGWRVGAGRVVVHLAFIVIALPTDKTGVMPGFDGDFGDAERCCHFGEGEQAGVAESVVP